MKLLNRKSFAVLLSCAFLGLLITACTPAFISDKNAKKFDYVVASADNDYHLTMAQLYQDLHDSNIALRGGIVDTATVRQLLDSIVVDSLTGFDAREVSLKDNYDQYRMFKSRYYDEILKAYVKEKVYDKVKVDSLETVKFYNDHPEIFSVKEHLNLFHILISPKALPATRDSLKYRGLSKEQLDEAAKKLVFEIRSKIHDSASFAAAAREYSHDTTTGSQGGFVGWTGRGEYKDPFDSVAFALRTGDISQPYHDSNGWHIIYCQKYVPAGLQPLDTLYYQAALQYVTNKKTSEIGKALADSIFALMKVRFNDALLDTNIFLVDGRDWLAIVNDRDTIESNDARSIELALRGKFRLDNTTPEMKKQMYTRLAQRLAMAESGIDSGLDTIPAMIAMKQGLEHKYRRLLIDKRRYDSDWKPSDSLIEAYYEAHKQEFQVDKPLVVQQIVVKDSVLGEFIRDQAESGVNFLELAKQYYPGDEDVREALADLGAIGPNDVSPEFWEAALKTPIGEVSHPVKTQFGYQLIKVLERKQALDLPHARSKIMDVLEKQHREATFAAYRDDIFKRYHVQFSGKLYPVFLKPASERHESRKNDDNKQPA